MHINLLENGLDSLRKGYESLNKYEELLISKSNELQKSLQLKNAIIQTHHGIEILMEFILQQQSEFLIFSNIDENVKKAYSEMHQKKLNSVFETDCICKVHTVTFIEAFERIISICNDKFSDEFIKKIKQLNLYRNLLTHSEIKIDDQEVILLFNGLLDELDLYFFNKIGKAYKTLSGYSELVENYDSYKKWLLENGMLEKAEVISKLTQIFVDLHINMGVNEVKRINDINVCIKLIKGLYSADFMLGMDLYNYTCSDKVTKIEKISKNHISIFAEDNNGEEIFKFRSLIIYNPQYSSNFSPIFIFESDEDNDLSEEELVSKKQDSTKPETFYIDGIKISTQKSILYDNDRINEMCEKIDSNSIDFTYHYVTKHLSRCLFCMINIQGLNYGNFNDLVSQYYKLSGEDIEIKLRQYLTK